MPSSADNGTQQAVWGHGPAPVPVPTHLGAALPLAATALMNDPAGGALCQRYYLVLWQLGCLEKEAIKMSLTET